MKKIKLMTIVGTRPELIKLSEVIKKLDIYFEHIFVHTGQNYDYQLNEVFFNNLNLRKPDIYLEVVGKHLGDTIGNIIRKSYELMNEKNPDAILILGDTNSALSALSAKRLKIPIFHMEAGNRCFDENLPEEINRKVVDHISDINLPYTEHARRYLLSEGIKKEHIFVTGSPLYEVINRHIDRIMNSDILFKLTLEKKKYILLSAHREENIDNEKNFISLMDGINNMAEYFNYPVIYSVHPRSLKYIKERHFIFHSNIRLVPPFSFTDYNYLQKNAFCVVSDSGTLAEESSMLGFPAVSIRTSTERPEALDKGGFVIGNIFSSHIIQSIEMATDMYIESDNIVSAYNVEKVSDIIVKIIQGYTSIINKKVWNK